MPIDKEIAKIAALIGDKTRANILIALMEGRALTAGELAIRANISPQTASNHLKKLMHAGLIAHVKTASRYRYFKINSPLVAQVLESLSLLTKNVKMPPPRHEKLDKDICFARSCYDHLAGKLGVIIIRSLLDKNFIRENEQEFLVTPEGEAFFKTMNIDCNHLLRQRRPLAKPCLDWTEREYHLSGSLGHAILEYFLQHRLLLRSKSKSRVVVLMTEGVLWLKKNLMIADL